MNQTITYTVNISLVTDTGEFPEDSAVTVLIWDQMYGLLDEATGLRCVEVEMNGEAVARNNPFCSCGHGLESHGNNDYSCEKCGCREMS